MANRSVLQIQNERCASLQAQLDRLTAACVEAIDWAHAQDEDSCPDWVDRMVMVMEAIKESK